MYIYNCAEAPSKHGIRFAGPIVFFLYKVKLIWADAACIELATGIVDIVAAQRPPCLRHSLNCTLYRLLPPLPTLPFFYAEPKVVSGRLVKLACTNEPANTNGGLRIGFSAAAAPPADPNITYLGKTFN